MRSACSLFHLRHRAGGCLFRVLPSDPEDDEGHAGDDRHRHYRLDIFDIDTPGAGGKDIKHVAQQVRHVVADGGDGQAFDRLLQSKLQPSALEMVDKHLLEFIGRVNPTRLKSLVEPPYPAIVMLIEFDDDNEHKQRAKAKKAEKILAHFSERYAQAADAEEQERLWTIRHSAAELLTHVDGTNKALPIIEDGIVPRERFQEFITAVYELFAKHHLDVAVWGHAGDANLHLQPFMDLTKLGDRQRVFKLMDEYYDIVLAMGGSPSGEHNDGRLRAPYLSQVYGPELYQVFQDVKRIFDPFGTLNPGVKIDVTKESIVPLLRHEFSIDHLYDQLPHS